MLTASLGPELGKKVFEKWELGGGTQGRAAPAGSPPLGGGTLDMALCWHSSAVMLEGARE